MNKETLELTKQLIAIRSVPEDRKALQEALDLCLSKLNGFTTEHFEENGAKSVLIYNRPERPECFKVLLNGHLDIIPGKDHQYTPVEKDGRLYGVGSMDMKANVACLIQVFTELADQVDYPLALQLVTDEELGGFHGTKYQIEQGVRAEFVISSETTNFNIVNQAKGIVWAKISTRGKTAHGAYPWRGENAIQKMNRFLVQLEQKCPVPLKQEWCTTVNVSSIQTSNQTFNKIPDDCEISLDIRFLPEKSDSILSELQELLPDDFKLEIVAQEPALDVDSSNPFLQSLQRICSEVVDREVEFYCAQGSSDARHYTLVNCPGVEFGPIGGGIGTDEEWVDIASLEQYQEVLRRFLRSYSRES